jgi:D-alanyl-D-alanine dipeptidase
MANSALNTDANGNYVTMRGWLESEVGINTIVDIHVNGISAYIDYIKKHGLIPCGLPPATAKGGGGAIAMMTLADAISSGKLVPIKDGDGGITVYIRYNTKDNIFKEDVYKEATELKPWLTYLTPDTLAKLKKAQEILQSNYGNNYSIVLWDGIRPNFIQNSCYNSNNPKTKYGGKIGNKSLFAPPYGSGKGSTHSFGTAVDVSIIRQNMPFSTEYTFDGLDKYLDMGKLEGVAIPGGFDDGSDYAPHWPTGVKLTSGQTANRIMLYSVMSGAGFSFISNEWWHFENQSYGGGRPSPIIK